MENIKSFVIENDRIKFPLEILKPSDPKTKSQKCRDSIKDEISGLLARGATEYVDKEQLPNNANILEGRLVRNRDRIRKI